MGLTINTTNHWKVWANRESVILLPPGGGAPATITDAKSRSVSVREQAASFGRYQSGDVKWYLPVVQTVAAGITPAIGWTVTDGEGTVWTVLMVDKTVLGAVWKLTTRNLAIALGDTIDIEVPTVTPGVTGARENAWSVKYPGLVARMQPERQETFEGRGKRTTATKYLCYVSQPIDPRNDAGDWGRIAFAGRYYEVTGYRNAARIDELPVVECVARDEPALPIPMAPTGLTVTAHGNGTLSLNWTPPAGTSLTYRIYRGTAANGEGATPIATASVAMYTDAAVLVGTRYYYKVSAVRVSVEGPKSAEANGLVVVATTQVYTTPGTFTFNAAGKTITAIRVWGGGGGGASTGGGGGGGGFASGVPTNSPASLTVTLQGGGAVDLHTTGNTTQVTWDAGASIIASGWGQCGNPVQAGEGGNGLTAGNVTSTAMHPGGNGIYGGGGGAGSGGPGGSADGVTGGVGGFPDGGAGASENSDDNGGSPGGGGSGGMVGQIVGFASPGGNDRVEIEYF